MPFTVSASRRRKPPCIQAAFIALAALLACAAPPAFAGGTALAFIGVPGQAQVGRPFGRQPVVVVLDASGNKATDWPAPVTIALKAATGAAGAVLSGATIADVTDGVATFEDLALDRIGKAFVLTATSPGLPPVDSPPFSVTLTGALEIPADNYWIRTGQHSSIPFVADGDIGWMEWAGAARYTLGKPEQDVIPGMWDGPQDYTGDLRLLWTSAGLRFALRVTDEYIRFVPHVPWWLWANDGVEFFFGLRDPQVPSRGVYDSPGDYQIIVSAGESEDGTLTPLWYSPQAPDSFSGPATGVAVKRTPDGYVMEGVLPLPGLSPQQGDIIGFNVMGKDRDDPSPGEDSAFSLTGLPNSSTDPAAWTQAALRGQIEWPALKVVADGWNGKGVQGTLAGPLTVTFQDMDGNVLQDFNEPVVFAFLDDDLRPTWRYTIPAVGGTATLPAWEPRYGRFGIEVECGGWYSRLPYQVIQKVRILSMEQQPSGARSGVPFKGQPYFQATDYYGSMFHGALNVSAALKPGTGTRGAHLIGHTTVVGRPTAPPEWPAYVSFFDLGIDNPGVGYVLTFTSDFATCDSQLFDVVPALISIPRRPSASGVGEMNVDGRVGWSEWLGAAEFRLGELPQDTTPGRWKGPEDYTGNARLLWDYDGLHFAVDVTDDVVSFPDTDPIDMWQRDGLEFFLGVGQNQDPARQTYDQPGDYHILISADEDADGNLTARWYSPQDPVHINGHTSNVAVGRTETGYVMEGVIPRNLLDPQGYWSVGGQIGLNIVARDLDSATPGPGSAFSLSWNPDSDTNPSKWLLATLAAANPIPASLTLDWRPGQVRAGIPFDPQPILTALGGDGKAFGPLSGVPASFVRGTGADTVLLGNPLSSPAASPASAMWTDLAVSEPGIGYALRFGDGGLYVDSEPFSVLPAAYTLADVARALRIAGGLDTATIEDSAFLTAAGSGAVNLEDALEIAARALGGEPPGVP